MFGRWFDWVIELPGWLRSTVAIGLALVGAAVCWVGAKVGLSSEAGKIGGAIIGLAIGLFAIGLLWTTGAIKTRRAH